MAKKEITSKAVSAQEAAIGFGLLALTVVLIVLLSLLTVGGAGGSAAGNAAYDAEVTAESPVRLSEIMSSNASSLMLADGTLPDWIEIENTGDTDFNLNGYALIVDGDPTKMYRFSGTTVPAGGYIVMLADDGTGEGHLPFRLASSGQTLTLMNAAGQAVDVVQVPSMESDQVWCRDKDGAWQPSFVDTPGEENRPNATAAENIGAEDANNGEVVISEVMARNATYAADENGEFWDYVELLNRSEADVSLKGW